MDKPEIQLDLFGDHGIIPPPIHAFFAIEVSLFADKHPEGCPWHYQCHMGYKPTPGSRTCGVGGPAESEESAMDNLDSWIRRILSKLPRAKTEKEQETIWEEARNFGKPSPRRDRAVYYTITLNGPELFHKVLYKPNGRILP